MTAEMTEPSPSDTSVVGRAESAGPAGTATDELSREIDALSLRQALLDFEMANARVLDLTARLVESHARVVKLQSELDNVGVEVDRARAEGEAGRTELLAEIERLRAHAAALETVRAHAEAAAAREHAELQALRASTTFRIVRGIGRVVNRIRR